MYDDPISVRIDVRYQTTIQREQEAWRRFSSSCSNGGYENEMIKFENPSPRAPVHSRHRGHRRFKFRSSRSRNVHSAVSQSMVEFYSEGKDFLIHVSPVDILEWSEWCFPSEGARGYQVSCTLLWSICIPVVDLRVQMRTGVDCWSVLMSFVVHRRCSFWLKVILCVALVAKNTNSVYLILAHYDINGVFLYLGSVSHHIFP